MTPNLDRLAANGLRFSSFYNTARCSPSRASLMTGLHPHQTGIGILTYDSGPEGYAGNLNHRCVTIPQVLKAAGYRTYMSGKWHVASSLTEADRRLADAARLRRLLRHDHRRRQLLRPEHADARQREHRARGARARLLLHRRDQRQRLRLRRAALRRRACRQAVLRVRRLHRAALAAARARRRHREVPRPLRRRLGPASPGAARQAGRERHPQRPLEAHRSRPDAAALDRGGEGRAVPRLDAALHGGLRGADRSHGPGHRPAARDAREARQARRHAGDLSRRQRRVRRGHSGGRDDRRAGRQAHDRAPNDAKRRAGALRQRREAHARAGEHVPELRHGVGQPLEQLRFASTSTGSTRAASRRR